MFAEEATVEMHIATNGKCEWYKRHSPPSLNPRNVVSEQVEPALPKQRLTVAKVLLSGINSSFTVMVSPDGSSLLITVKTPRLIVIFQQLYKEWLTSTENDHTELYLP